MYQPSHFQEPDAEVQRGLIRQNPLGLLITSGPAGLIANAVPFLLNRDGTFLQAHLARANGQIAELELVSDCLIVFQGPQAYVTPQWYETKKQTGKVVPTWNYVIVQVRGRPRVIGDQDWIRQQIDRLTVTHEAATKHPWNVTDAPEAYISSQMKGIVGVEIAISDMTGKWKVSQNRPEADRNSVHRGLQSSGNSSMAHIVAAYGAAASSKT
jgi:transcriptional regulator